MRNVVLAILLLLTAGVGCTKRHGAQDVEVIEIDGVPTVQNPAEPLERAAPWEFRGRTILSNRDAGPDTSFAFVGELAVGIGGELYVLDPAGGRVQVFDSRGRFVAPLAPTGEGPGEISRPTSISVDSSGRVYVLDSPLRRIQVFGPNRTFLRTIALSTGSPAGIRVDAGGRIYLQLLKFYPGESGKQDFRLVRIDTAGSIVAEVGTFPLIRLHPIRRGQMLSFIMTGFEPVGRWTVAPDGRVACGFGSQYEIQVYDSEGNQTLRIRRQWTPLPVTEEEKRKALERIRDEDLRRRVVVPSDKPAFGELVFDDLGYLWAEIDRHEPNHTYDVFDPQGRLRFRIDLPGRLMCFGRGAAYVLQQVEDGTLEVQRLRRIELKNVQELSEREPEHGALRGDPWTRWSHVAS